MKMKKTKRFIVLLLISIALLCGCGARDNVTTEMTRDEWYGDVTTASADTSVFIHSSSYSGRSSNSDRENAMKIIMYIFIYLIYGSVWGIVCKKVIYNKGYQENWFWWGFLFGIFAFLVAISKTQKINENIQEKQQSTYEKKSALELLAEQTENERILREGGWKCSKCGRINYSGQVNCNCGQRKPNKYADIDKKSEEYKLRDTDWKCKKCGNMNPKNSYICKCGLKKSENDNYVPENRNIENERNEIDNIEIIKKYKELLDMGAITQEEFDLKKTELL